MYRDATGSHRDGQARRARAAVAFAAALAAVLSLAPPAMATSHDLCLDGGTAPALAGAEYLRSYRAGLHTPSRLALDAADNLHVTDPARNRISVRADDGRLTARETFPAPPLAIAIDDAGGRPATIYVGENAQGRVAVYDAAWTPLRELGAGAGEFQSVNDIAIDPATGAVYVVDALASVVRIFGADGAPLGGFGGLGGAPGQFDFPASIAIDPWRGEALVADQLNFRIQIFDLDGNFICRLGDANGSNPGGIFGTRTRLFTVPQGLAVDEQGRIYVADAAEGRVRVVDRNGAILGTIGGFGEGPDRLRVPLDLAIDGHNRLFVSDSNNGRLVVYGLETFDDPELYAPGEAVVTPDPFDHQGFDERFTAVIEIAGYRLDEVSLASITANGVPMEPGSAEIGDFDGDLAPDIRATFPRGPLAATLPPEGPAEIVLRGAMTELDFDAVAVIAVTGGIVDGDGDGVLDDVDRCLDTAAGAVIDADGCAIAQLCPCAAQFGGAPWAQRGDYVACTQTEARRFADAGLIGRAEIGGIVSAAARAECRGDG